MKENDLKSNELILQIESKWTNFMDHFAERRSINCFTEPNKSEATCPYVTSVPATRQCRADLLHMENSLAQTINHVRPAIKVFTSYILRSTIGKVY